MLAALFGKRTWLFVMPHLVQFSPVEAEAMALCVALTGIHELSLCNVILESDCKAVVDEFHSSQKDYYEFGCLVSRCRSLASMIENISIIQGLKFRKYRPIFRVSVNIDTIYPSDISFNGNFGIFL